MLVALRYPLGDPAAAVLDLAVMVAVGVALAVVWHYTVRFAVRFNAFTVRHVRRSRVRDLERMWSLPDAPEPDYDVRPVAAPVPGHHPLPRRRMPLTRRIPALSRTSQLLRRNR